MVKKNGPHFRQGLARRGLMNAMRCDVREAGLETPLSLFFEILELSRSTTYYQPRTEGFFCGTSRPTPLPIDRSLQTVQPLIQRRIRLASELQRHPGSTRRSPPRHRSSQPRTAPSVGQRPNTSTGGAQPRLTTLDHRCALQRL